MLEIVKYVSTLSLKAALIAAMILLLSPKPGAAEDPLKPMGTAEDQITLWLPDGSIEEESPLATANYIAEIDLPAGITYPPDTVGQAFTFGIWRGDSTTQRQFVPSIVINIEYQDEEVPPAARSDEQLLHLHMYDPAAEAWIKLCGSVDVHENVVSAALSLAVPYQENDESSLLALAIDHTPPLEQVLEGRGTTITIRGSTLKLQVPSQAVRDGAHFAITPLSRTTAGGLIQILSRPADIKLCWADPDIPTQKNRQLTDFPISLQVGFNYDADTLSRAGGRANLTIGNLQNRRWIDVEEIGSRITRESETITADMNHLGTFGLAVR